MKTYAVGVDLGGTTVKMGLFDENGLVLDKWEIPTDVTEGGSHILPDIAASVAAELEKKGVAAQQVRGIGLCVPGPVDDNGTVNKCVNLGWGVVDVRRRMNELLQQIPHVAVGNDANVAALGELWQGGGRGCGSAAMFTLGTGVGGGVVLKGDIVTGSHGGGGEVGHMTVEPGETEPCACGKRGCLEQYASASGVVRMGRKMLEQCDTPSGLRERPNFTAKDICDLAREGDKLALAILDRCGDYLGRAMSYVACTVDPDVFIVGGGMSRAGAVVTDAIEKYYRQYAFHPSAGTPVRTAQLGNDAGIYGCAKMVLGD